MTSAKAEKAHWKLRVAAGPVTAPDFGALAFVPLTHGTGDRIRGYSVNVFRGLDTDSLMSTSRSSVDLFTSA